MKKYRFTAFFEPQEEGGFTVTVPSLPGCISEGDSFEEAQANIAEAIQSYLGSLMVEGEPLPRTRTDHKVISPVDISFNPKAVHRPNRSALYA